MAEPRFYRPRWSAVLVVPDDPDGISSTEIPVRVRTVRLEQNDHNHADRLQLGLDWFDAGADPRFLAGGQVLFYLGQADASGNWAPIEADLLFQGIITRAQRQASGEERSVEIDCLDYTALFLRAKPFAAHGVPDNDMTLADAWGRILDGFPDADAMHNLFDGKLEFRGLEFPGPVINKAVADRFRGKGGKVVIDPKGSAWDVWQRCVGMCGLTSYFELDKVVVTSTDTLYSVTDPPVLVLGDNIECITEERDNNFELRGVRCSSYDPDTGRVIEAKWPPDDSEEAKNLKGKKGKGKNGKTTREYETFDVPHVTDPKLLEDVAKHAFTQWAIQTFRGTLVTHEMSVETQGGALFDLLRLRHGDSIQVGILEEQLDALRDKNRGERAAYFESRGYTTQVADYMAKRLDDIAELRREFYVKCVNIEAETDNDGGTFKVECSYINKVLPAGDATS